MGIDVIVPVYKPDKKFERLFAGLLSQTVKPDRIILMVTQAEGAGCADIRRRLDKLMRRQKICGRKRIEVSLVPVRREEFDHGGTRRQAVAMSDADYFLMMTQDAVPADDYLLERLLAAVKEENCAVAYARQCASMQSGIVEQYTRLFNYPVKSCTKTKADLPRLGIKTYFCSDVCAMYKRRAYDAAGGFEVRTIFNEDSIIAARLIESGYCISYVAEARVLHTHNYTLREQFKRNFDLGVSHTQYREIFAAVPAAKEGTRLVKNTLEYLLGQRRYVAILDLVFQSAAKYLGYCMGRAYFIMPKPLLLKCALNRAYFENYEPAAGKEQK